MTIKIQIFGCSFFCLFLVGGKKRGKTALETNVDCHLQKHLFALKQ